MNLPRERLPPFAGFSGYVAHGGAIDPGPLMRRLEALGRAALPAARDHDSPLEFRCFDLDDPLKNAADAILASHRGRLERTDARNLERVLSSVAELMAACPAELAAVSSQGAAQ